MTLRRFLHRQLEPLAWPHRGLSPLNGFLVVAILAATAAAIVQTEPLIAGGREHPFRVLERSRVRRRLRATLRPPVLRARRRRPDQARSAAFARREPEPLF